MESQTRPDVIRPYLGLALDAGRSSTDVEGRLKLVEEPFRARDPDRRGGPSAVRDVCSGRSLTEDTDTSHRDDRTRYTLADPIALAMCGEGEARHLIAL